MPKIVVSDWSFFDFETSLTGSLKLFQLSRVEKVFKDISYTILITINELRLTFKT